MRARRVLAVILIVTLAVLLGLGFLYRDKIFLFTTALNDRDLAEGLDAPLQKVSPLQQVSAIGRIEPGDGVIRVAGPPRPVIVVGEILVQEGDRVSQGQPLAVLVGTSIQRAEVSRLEAELSNAEREWSRNLELFKKRTLSESGLHAFELDREVAAARLAGARAELELSTVKSPIAGQVLDIHTRASERVGSKGILELGDTSVMYAIGEVYETDIGRVKRGQSATVHGPALGKPLHGVVERIGLKIGKKDVLSTDPVADAEARVVEVKIRLQEPERAARLTNMRVDVIIGKEQ
jgi:HlyD family secretion protein